MRRLFKENLLQIAIIFLFSVLYVFELFTNTGQSANMDGTVHITTANLFAKSLLQGNFPVSWIDHFANYGLPLGLISQQFTSYLDALWIILFHDPVLSLNITIFLGVLFSSLFYYFFLRIYFEKYYSLIGVIIFNLIPYRILNIYIRGAIPEFFTLVFVPLLLIALYLMIEKKRMAGFFLAILSTALLILTHPFMLVVNSQLIFPYALFLLFKNHTVRHNGKKLIIRLTSLAVAVGAGLGMASYYFIPLNREIKYFYYGLTTNHLTPNNSLLVDSFFGKEFYYFTKYDVFSRGFFVSVGNVETIITILGVVYLLWKWLVKKDRAFSIFEFSLIITLIYMFFVSRLSDPLYTHISLLSNIQFPWRMLNGFIVVLPILAVYLLQKFNKAWLGVLLIVVVCTLRFPQFYGKNYTIFPESYYSFTSHNLHAVVMNPIWSTRSEDYPIETLKPKILEGDGTITINSVKDTMRSYTIEANTELHMIDFTFYFPGWKLRIDGKETPIQYQDPAQNYKGVITYYVPQGTHQVELKFEDTAIRKIAKLLSLMSLGVIALFAVFHKRLQKLLLLTGD